MEKKNIKKYVGAGLLAVALAAGTGVVVNDAIVDHTKEICPITQIMLDAHIDGISRHQIPAMNKDYQDNGIDVVEIAYAENYSAPTGYQITGNYGRIYAKPLTIPNEDGTISYSAPRGFWLTQDKDGNLICYKDIDLQHNYVITSILNESETETLTLAR